MPAMYTMRQKVSCTSCDWNSVTRRKRGDLIGRWDFVPSYPVCPRCGESELEATETSTAYMPNPVESVQDWKNRLHSWGRKFLQERGDD